MPRACSINAVVSPPTPPPTMMAFMHATRNATPRAICAPRGTGDQPPGSHTVSGVYEVALTAVNGAEIGQETRMTRPLTLFDKLWAPHEILKADNGLSLMWVDRHYVHEGSFQGFDKVEARNAKVARPDLTFGIADHYVPTARGRVFDDPSLKRMVEQLTENTGKHGVMLM